MNLVLTEEEAKGLSIALAFHLDGLRTELAHTDRRAFRESLREEIERLDVVLRRIREGLLERRRPGRQPL